MRASMFPAAGLLLLAIALFPACSNEAAQASPPAQASAASGLPDRDPALAHKLVSEGAVLLDVRTPGEFAAGHLDGAVNVPVDELESRMPEIDKLAGGDKNRPIVVYCQAGGRAGRAKQKLVDAGHPQVTNLGGMRDWDEN